MKAIIWNYRFPDMKSNWSKQTKWMVNALQNEGVEVKAHPNFICSGLNLPEYDFKVDRDADICIYNHTDMSYIIGNVLQVKKNWFFKPTVPDDVHTTLDELGYGPYSTVTYERPDFDSVDRKDVNNFFNTKVKAWISNKTNKWGNKLEVSDLDIEEDDYYLVLGQCGGDSVVTHFDFGSYFTKLEQVVRELSRIDNRTIIVKLHPYTDGEEGTAGCYKNNEFSLSIKTKLEKIKNVKVYIGKVNVHNFIPKARCVLLANSGAGFEVMMHHKPMITWGFPEYHWVTYDLRHLAELNEAIKLDWFDSIKQDKFLYWYMEEYCFYDQETANRRVKELLSNIAPDNFNDLWRKHQPSQTKEEFKAFFNFIKPKISSRPVIVEIGVRSGNQRYFYKELLNADYKGIDINTNGCDDFIKGDSHSIETLNKLKQWLNGRKIEVLFIDGDHTYEGLKKDNEMYSPLSVITAFHDIVTPNPINSGVRKFWNEYSKDKNKIEIINNGDGIGVIL